MNYLMKRFKDTGRDDWITLTALEGFKRVLRDSGYKAGDSSPSVVQIAYGVGMECAEIEVMSKQYRHFMDAALGVLTGRLSLEPFDFEAKI